MAFINKNGYGGYQRAPAKTYRRKRYTGGRTYGRKRYQKKWIPYHIYKRRNTRRYTRGYKRRYYRRY